MSVVWLLGLSSVHQINDVVRNKTWSQYCLDEYSRCLTLRKPSNERAVFINCCTDMSTLHG